MTAGHLSVVKKSNLLRNRFVEGGPDIGAPLVSVGTLAGGSRFATVDIDLVHEHRDS